MANDKFSYLLNDDNSVKEVSDFDVLQLDNDYFNNHSGNDFKAHLKDLLLDFHPDNNAPEDKVRATEAFKRIVKAIAKIKDNLAKNNNKYVNASDDSFELDFNVDSAFVSIAKWIGYELNVMQILLNKAKALPDPDGKNLPAKEKANHSVLIDSSSTFSAIFDVFRKNYSDVFRKNFSESIVYPDVIQTSRSVFFTLAKKARTGEDFYKLASEQKIHKYLGDPEYSFLKPASFGHILACQQVAEYALQGTFKPKESALIWALDYLHELQTTILPALDPIKDKDTLDSLNRDLPKTLERAGLKADGVVPPKDSEEYKSLLANLKNTTNNHGIYQFTLHRPASQLIKDYGKSAGYMEFMDRLALFEKYLNENYTAPDEIKKNMAFIQEARGICMQMESISMLRDENQKGFKSVIRSRILEEANSHYHHRHGVIRALADLVFIPLGLATAGVLFIMKAATTNSVTFFVDKKTNRQEKLEEFLYSPNPGNIQ